MYKRLHSNFDTTPIQRQLWGPIIIQGGLVPPHAHSLHLHPCEIITRIYRNNRNDCMSKIPLYSAEESLRTEVTLPLVVNVLSKLCRL